ncbi:MAG: PAS domain-containing protein [Kiritimatiellaeota bacterium]|nr:PAS domain-containing protein [Kiritimatiellota bacterium]
MPGTLIERLADRLDELDSSSVQAYILRLVKEKGFLETVFNSIREGVLVIDQTLVIRYANEACRQLLGLHEEFVGRRIDRFLREVDWPGLMQADPEQWQRISLQEIEVFYPVHRYLSFYLVPLPSSSGNEIRLAALILRDVTAAREVTEKTVESRRIEAITALAAGVAHEIGNPLNSLTIHLQLLRRAIKRSKDADLAAEGEELLDVALQEVRRLDSIVHNFLRAVRPAAPSLERVSIERVLTESLEFMRHEIEDRNVLVQASWPDNLPRILADPAQLKQAFYNLIKNAIQAMSEGGVLRIVCEEQRDFLAVRFADTGKGISAKDMSRVMDPYFSTRGDGTGLGLLIVERIVRSHGGELAIDSRPGEGVVVTVRLPLRQRQLRLLAAPPASDDNPAEGGDRGESPPDTDPDTAGVSEAPKTKQDVKA